MAPLSPRQTYKRRALQEQEKSGPQKSHEGPEAYKRLHYGVFIRISLRAGEWELQIDPSSIIAISTLIYETIQRIISDKIQLPS